MKEKKVLKLVLIRNFLKDKIKINKKAFCQASDNPGGHPPNMELQIAKYLLTNKRAVI